MAPALVIFFVAWGAFLAHRRALTRPPIELEILVAWALALVWRRAGPWLALWAALVGPALVLVSAHTISDIVGGAFVGLIAVVAAHPLAVAPVAARAPG